MSSVDLRCVRTAARLRPILVASLTVACALAASGAHAEATFVIHQLTPDRASYVEVTNPTGPVTASVATWAFGQPALTGAATHFGSAVLGEVKSSVAASGDGFYAFGWSGWRDSIRIDGGARNGEHAIVTFAIDYSWALSTIRSGTATVMASSYVDMNFGLGGTHIQYAMFGETQTDGGANSVDIYYQAARDGGLVVGNPTYDATTAFLSFDVVLGTEYLFDGGINTFVSGQYGSANADAAQTMRWGGIASVVDRNGQNLPVAVDSGSGFDYSQRYVAAVPEPQQWTLLGLGLALLAGMQSTQGRRKVERHATTA